MNRIKEVLEQKGIKQIWLAEQLEKSYNTINEYASLEITLLNSFQIRNPSLNFMNMKNKTLKPSWKRTLEK
jgi:hypothetical protein